MSTRTSREHRRGLTFYRSVFGGDVPASEIAMRARGWPDAFPRADPVLQRAAAEPTFRALHARARMWRSWRAYAAVNLRVHDALAAHAASPLRDQNRHE
jgi:hypothetical protein